MPRRLGRGAAIAQLVEHRIRNAGVGGSSPSCGTTLFTEDVLLRSAWRLLRRQWRGRYVADGESATQTFPIILSKIPVRARIDAQRPAGDRGDGHAPCTCENLPLRTGCAAAKDCTVHLSLEALLAKKQKLANHRAEYSKDDIRQLKTLIKSRAPMAEIAEALGRTPAGVRMKAYELGITKKRRPSARVRGRPAG